MTRWRPERFLNIRWKSVTRIKVASIFQCLAICYGYCGDLVYFISLLATPLSPEVIVKLAVLICSFVVTLDRYVFFNLKFVYFINVKYLIIG